MKLIGHRIQFVHVLEADLYTIMAGPVFFSVEMWLSFFWGGELFQRSGIYWF